MNYGKSDQVYTILVIGIVMGLYGGLNDIEPVTIIGVLLAVIAVMYNLILKHLKNSSMNTYKNLPNLFAGLKAYFNNN